MPPANPVLVLQDTKKSIIVKAVYRLSLSLCHSTSHVYRASSFRTSSYFCVWLNCASQSSVDKPLGKLIKLGMVDSVMTGSTAAELYSEQANDRQHLITAGWGLDKYDHAYLCCS